MHYYEANNKFDWGETIKVNDSAPSKYRPGEIASVCGMTKTKSKILADKYDSYLGEWVYTIEYIGGSEIEIPERYLGKY